MSLDAKHTHTNPSTTYCILENQKQCQAGPYLLWLTFLAPLLSPPPKLLSASHVSYVPINEGGPSSPTGTGVMANMANMSPEDVPSC